MIKKISDSYGADDKEWLKEYCREMIAKSEGDKINDTIRCFESFFVPRRTLEGGKDAAKEKIHEKADSQFKIPESVPQRIPGM